ncbi:MAG TPA: restriction endonuclease subunit S [Abditibacteriaceae bacterium]|jgi:type I restriction enzyme S subunit
MARGRRCTIAGVAATEVTGLKAFAAKSAWLAEEGLRLDATAYVTGGLQARDKILARGDDWKPLGKVARLEKAPRFLRRYVYDRERGIPMLSSSDILLCDINSVSLLSNTIIKQHPDLLLQEGWTLISRSGTVGNTAYVRPELAGLAASEHVMRAIPRDGEILPGFLFAFLTSDNGQAQLKQATYGSVIQHIEPHHIADLPVPLPDKEFGERIHGLVESAALKRTEAAQLLQTAAKYFDELAGPMRLPHDHARAVGIVRSGHLAARLDAFHHIGWATESEKLTGRSLHKLAAVTRPGIYKRIFVKRGVPVVTGIDVFQLRPSFRVRLMRSEVQQANSLIKHGQILVQRSGSRNGLIGRPAYVGKRLDDWAATEDLVRVSPFDSKDAALIFAFLSSDAGHRAVLRTSYGTTIPHINPEGLRNLQIPTLPQALVEGAARALVLREEADAEEEAAINEVEAWLS